MTAAVHPITMHSFRPMPLAALRAPVCAALLCCLATLSQAADPGASAPGKGGIGSLGKGPGNSLPILTRDELRTCLQQQDKLKADEDGILGEQRDLDAEKAAIAQQESALKGELAGLDRTAASAVEGYNAKAVEHERRIDAYNQRSRPFNAKVQAWQGERERWVTACSNRRYKEDDLIIIKAGR
jgi:hypothetical protein